MCVNVNKGLLACLYIMPLLVGSIIGLTFFQSKARVQGDGIIIEGADYNSTVITEYSAELINITKSVTPRAVIEYGDFNSKLDLNKSDELNQVASAVSSRITIEYADCISTYRLNGSETLTQIATTVTPRIIVEYADSVISSKLERPMFELPVVRGVEKSFVESTLVETLLGQNAVLNDVEVSGDLNGTLNFTSFEIVNITTGSFAGKGFSKGEWEATLEGLSYRGYWRGALFLKPSERKIYLKGAVSGEISATVEGHLTETLPGSGNYDRYQATWEIGRLGVKTVSATVTLNGTFSYLSASEFPATELYFLQTSIEGTVSGSYDGSLSAVLTHIRVLSDIPYKGEGFSTISYISDAGKGEGWTYDRLVSPSMVELKGLFTNPFSGTVSATLDETKMPRTLLLRIERVDFGLPPMAKLKIESSGPHRVSPGQTITYTVELRNEGLKSAENVTVVMNLPYLVKYASSTAGGVYNSRSHEVVWRLGNVPPKSLKLFTAIVTVAWGLPSGTTIEPILSVPVKEIDVQIDPTVSVIDELLEATENLVRVKSYIANQSISGTLDIEVFSATVAEEIEPTFQLIEEGDEVTITFQFTIKGFSWKKIWGVIRGLKAIFQIRDMAEDARDISRYVIKTQDLLDFAFEKGMLTPKKYAHFSELASNVAHVELIIPNAIRQYPIVGEVYYKSTKGIFGWIATWWFPKHLEKAIQIDTLNPDFRLEDLYKLYLEEKSYDVSSTESQIAVARDPNVKYGPEGYVSPGETLTYNVECENEGEGIAFGVYFTDTLDEDLDDSTLEIGPVFSKKNGSLIAGPGTYDPSTRTITWFVGEVGPGESCFVNFSVKVKDGLPEGTEIINFATVYFPSVPETTQTNAIVSVVGQPRIAVTDVAPLESVIEKGSIMCINVTVANEGYLTETFNLTLYANTTVIQTKNVTLIGRSSDSVIFVWNTTNFAKGNYTIGAYAWPVPDETETDDNLYADGIVQVTVPGVPDNTPPTTTVSLDGVLGDNGWFTSEVTVTLSATDDVSGVDKIEYSFDNATWTIYTTPFTVSVEGNTTIYYRSMDEAGNVEAIKTETIRIDKTTPVANAGQDQIVKVGETVTFDASNTTDNVDIVSYEWDFGDETTGTGVTTTHMYTSPGTYTVTLTVKDEAGNTATHRITITVLAAEAFPIWTVGVAVAAIAIATVAIAVFWRKRKQPTIKG